MYQQKIEEYLDGKLSEEEMQAFREKAQSDPDLKAELLTHVLARKSIEDMARSKVREQLQSLVSEKGAPTIPGSIRLLSRRAIAAAAAIAVIAVLAILLLLQRESTDVSMASAYYVVASAPNTARSEEVISNLPPIMQAGRQEFYLRENYREAARIFGSVEREQYYFSAAQYYLAHCFFKMGDYQKAASSFETLLTSQDLPVYVKKEELRWNLMVSYLGQGRKALFRELLEQFAGDPNLKDPYKGLVEKLKTSQL